MCPAAIRCRQGQVHMLFNVSGVEAQHRPLIQNGNLGDAYRVGTMGCVRLIEEVVRGGSWNDERATFVVIDLGVRIINNCGAAGQLALSGFWSAAGHQVRDMVECHQLIEYFRYQPSEAQRWFDCEGMERYQQFGFGRVFRELEKLRGKAPFDLKQSFDFYSNAGSHPSRVGLAWQMTELGDKIIGPVPHTDRFRLFTGDLWAHATRATLDFVDTVDALNPDRAPIRDQFRFRHAVVAGGRKLLGRISADEALACWK
ncbi:hypothetical protein [Mesorhizobium sp.]|uniref:hypothetical protein n=1 Tax=Mesorhizobium sp. TaxID=1871066 RepID=UPI000FE3C772|nr:hypothetical protein [Mesorhizobium sp.]RWN51196.1 MAG: hypothetical protein EOR98_27530 [Mesorhizobium sp.]RWN72357.1 MAG: hypothetical protein EOS02_27920 [Mesorhizobium sp.]RWN72787.1 MAG: hypothetical protein EOS01_27965 [Mesorhizobium sp.]RWN84297.1 MAG: hypothetical protein EOS04_25670 [Mesorhizobium sp.]RWO08738.1 MAG: hypothetical protein EOS15_28715 [Mesorhizobium sp.]